VLEQQEKEKQDLFYRAIQALISNSVAEATSYDTSKAQMGEVPGAGCLAFPIIVVDGNLFEAYYDFEKDDVILTEVKQIRVLWRGSTAHSRLITPVDVVTLAGVDEFARKRASEIKTLLRLVRDSIANIQQAFAHQEFSKLCIKNGPRGFTGLPPLLTELYKLEKAKGPKKSAKHSGTE
jgi:hypothetical protein